MVGGPYLVDNTNPLFKGLKASYPRVQGVVSDRLSRVTGIQYSLDDGKSWQPVGPRDGVFDTSLEAFSFRLPNDLKKKRYVLLVRAFDEAGNAVVEKRIVKVKR